MAKKYLKLGSILKGLLFANDMKAVDLAREVNLPPPTIHRLITGKTTRPYESSLKPIADYFSVSLEQLLGEASIPNVNAPTNKQSNLFNQSKVFNVPVIKWEKIILLNKSCEFKENKTILANDISERGFATVMPDFSMEPIFPKGSLLIFDPEQEAKDRSYVLVILHENKLPVFRQLLIDLDNRYLKPLNPDLNSFPMRSLEEMDTFIGTLIEARQLYERN